MLKIGRILMFHVMIKDKAKKKKIKPSIIIFIDNSAPSPAMFFYGAVNLDTENPYNKLVHDCTIE